MTPEIEKADEHDRMQEDKVAEMRPRHEPDLEGEDEEVPADDDEAEPDADDAAEDPDDKQSDLDVPGGKGIARP